MTRIVLKDWWETEPAAFVCQDDLLATKIIINFLLLPYPQGTCKATMNKRNGTGK